MLDKISFFAGIALFCTNYPPNMLKLSLAQYFFYFNMKREILTRCSVNKHIICKYKSPLTVIWWTIYHLEEPRWPKTTCTLCKHYVSTACLQGWLSEPISWVFCTLYCNALVKLMLTFAASWHLLLRINRIFWLYIPLTMHALHILKFNTLSVAFKEILRP